MGNFDKKAYDQQYKRDNFDNIAFYAPRGTKNKLMDMAVKRDISLSELLRRLCMTAIEYESRSEKKEKEKGI